MIKFKFTRQDKTPGLGFGLSAENIKRLQAGQPIVINLSEMGVKAEMIIFYGETEQSMYENLKHMIGPDTEVHGQ